MKTTKNGNTTESTHVAEPLLGEKQNRNFFSASLNSKSFFGPSTIQPRLKVGQPNDKYEQEADRVADAVMRMPDPQIQRQPEEEEELQMKQLPNIDIHRKCEECEKEEKVQQKRQNIAIQRKCKECEENEQLQKKSDGNTQSANHASSKINSQLSSRSGRGSRLPKGIQSEMGNKMGADFSGVNIHTDSTAHQMSQQLGARAFTHGSDIYFNRGEYNPSSNSGKRLLAHELTHVVQQGTDMVSLPMIQRVIEGPFRVEWRNKIDSEIKDRGNAYATAIVAGISAASMPNNYDDSVKTFLENMQTNLGKYALSKVLDNVPGGGAINAAVGAMIDTKSQIEADNIREAYANFKSKTREVLLAGVDRMTRSEGQFNQRIQDLIMARVDSNSRFNEPPSGIEDADRYSERMQTFIQRNVNQQMFGNSETDFSQMITDVNDFIQRSFQYFILARAEIMAGYRQCMGRQTTEGSICDQGFFSWRRYPRECRHEQCEQWLTYSPMPHNWSGPQPRQEHLGMCAGQPCTWFTVSTGVEHPAGYASVRESEYRRQRERYKR